MESLTRSSSRIVVDNFNVGGYKDQLFLSRISCPKRLLMGVNLTNSLIKHQTILPILPAASDSQASETAVDGENQLSTTTARVKFQLQKACGFGDHFLMVGDDPLFGSWDVQNAITLEWSDGHVWTAEVDIPVEKTIQFKFILKRSTGDIIWQPGPDRIFKTWTTTKTITVVEDWENSELQKIVEDGVPSQDKELLLKTDVKRLEEIQQADKARDTHTTAGMPENSLLHVAENSKIVGSVVEEGSYPGKEELTISMMVADNIVSDHRRFSSTEGLEDEEVILSDPVLVPGLTPAMSNLSTDGSPLANKDKSSDLNGSLRSQDSKDQTALESCTNLKAESEEVKLQLQEEMHPNLFSQQENLEGGREEPDSGFQQESLKVELEEEQSADISPKRENRSKMKFSDEIEFDNPHSDEVGSQKDMALHDSYCVLKNDMHWGCKTLQNLLASFGLF